MLLPYDFHVDINADIAPDYERVDRRLEYWSNGFDDDVEVVYPDIRMNEELLRAHTMVVERVAAAELASRIIGIEIPPEKVELKVRSWDYSLGQIIILCRWDGSRRLLQDIRTWLKEHYPLLPVPPP